MENNFEFLENKNIPPDTAYILSTIKINEILERLNNKKRFLNKPEIIKIKNLLSK